MRKLVTFTAPVPTNLAANIISSTVVRLDWALPVDSRPVDSYKIYRNGTLIGTSLTSDFDDINATASHSYTYGVTSIINYVNESTSATIVNNTALSTIPANLTATVISGTEINLTWSASTISSGTIVGYRLRRGGTIINSSANALSFSDTGLTQNTTYSYTISALDALGSESLQSLAKTAKTFDTAAPAVPTGLTATVVSTTQINLAWNASTDNVGTTGYKLYRNDILINGSGSATAFNDGGLAAGTTYSYTVAAFDARNNLSAETTPILATTIIGTMPTITVTAPLDGATISGNSTTLSADVNVNVTWPTEGPTMVSSTTYQTTAAYVPPNTYSATYPLSDQANTGAWAFNTAYSDEFNTSTLNSVKWNNIRASLADEVANLVPKTTGLEFHMRDAGVGATGNRYKGAYIASKTTFLYGYFEISAKIAKNYANSNMYLYADTVTESTEMDIMAIYGLPVLTKNENVMDAIRFHSPTTPSALYGPTTFKLLNNVAFGDAYHVYGFNWTPTILEWYIDGHLIRTTPNTSWHQATTLYVGLVDGTNAMVDMPVADIPNIWMTAKYVRYWQTQNIISPIAGVQFKIDDISVGAEDTVAPYSTIIDSTTIADGNHIITALARAVDGNTSESAGITVNVNNVELLLPDVVVTALTYNAGIFTGTVSNIGTAAVASPTRTGIRFTTTIGGVTTVVGTASAVIAIPINGSINLSNTTPYILPEGTYIIDAYADDINRFTEIDETNNHYFKTITVAGSGVGNTLSGVKTVVPVTNLNLSTKGTLDWWKYGITAGQFDTSAKLTTDRFIGGAYTKVPGFNAERSNSQTFQWVGGAPITTGSANGRGLSSQTTVNSGWNIAVESTTTTRIFTIYFEVVSCTVTFTASVADGSSVPYTNTITAATGVSVIGNYAITFKTSTVSTLNISFNINSVSTTPSLTIQASTLE